MTDDEGLMLGDVDPEWMTDGGGVSGEQSDPDFDEGGRQWDTTCYSQQNQSPEDFIGGGCP